MGARVRYKRVEMAEQTAEGRSAGVHGRLPKTSMAVTKAEANMPTIGERNAQAGIRLYINITRYPRHTHS
jgi:hypothetical protein